MTQTVDARFLVRATLAADATSGNPVPLDRELWLESDTGRIKFGDGVTAWNLLPYFSGSSGGLPFGVGSGTGDAITATLAGSPGLVDGLTVSVRAPGANTLVNPTLAIGGGSAIVITKLGGLPLAQADIARAGHDLILGYNATSTPVRWELINPGKGSGSTSGGSAGVEQLVVVPLGTGVTIGSSKAMWLAPFDCNITDFLVGVLTPSTSGPVTLDLKGSSGTSILSALPSVAAAGHNSLGSPAAVNSGDSLVRKGDYVTVDVTAAGTGAAGVVAQLSYAPYAGDGSAIGWRILVTANNGSSYTRILEIEFRGTPNGPTLTTGGTPFASTAYSGQPASGAFDGLIDGTPGHRWTSDGSALPQYVGYLFAAPVSVVEIGIAGGYTGDSGGSQNVAAFSVQYSTDTTTGLDGTWKTLFTETVPSWPELTLVTYAPS